MHLDGLTIEIYHNGVHCCRHQLSLKSYGYTTKNDHMPPNHAFVRGMRPEWFIEKAREIGTSAAAVAEIIMKKCSHPQQGFRAVQGLLALVKTYEPERVENACEKALHFKSTNSRISSQSSKMALTLSKYCIFRQRSLLIMKTFAAATIIRNNHHYLKRIQHNAFTNRYRPAALDATYHNGRITSESPFHQ